jgi:PAS domain S-box-containing protein
MIGPSSLVAILRERFLHLDLRGKITAALLAGALSLGAVVTLTAYFAAYYQINQQVQIQLEGWTRVEQREIELPLAAVAAVAESIASNTVTANALADSRGREIYLAPLLRNQKLAVPGTSLTVVDYRGRPVASNLAQAPDYSSDPSFAAMMASGRPLARVQLQAGRDTVILLALPIRYRLTDHSEGGVMLRIPLLPLLAPSSAAESRWIENGDGWVAVGHPPARNVFKVDTRLQLPAPLHELNLTFSVARDRADALRSINLLMILFLVIGIGVILGVLAFARAGARYITAPLGDVALAAEQIAASGKPGARLPEPRNDEFGRLTIAFNTMVDRLADSYAELESRVAARTRDYQESRIDADKAAKLLQEAVSSIAQGFTIYDENDRLVLCNEAYLTFYDTSRDIIVPGNSFEEIVRKGAERGQYSEAVGRIDEWVAQRVAQHQSADGKVIEQQLADGRWLLIVEYRTPSGYIVGNRIDITELKSTTGALRQRELYLRATLDNLPFMFWLKDADSRFLAVNTVFSDACDQANPDSVAGLTDYDVWPHDLAESYRDDDIAVMNSGHDKTVEEPIVGRGGKRWIETYKKPVISPEGQILGTVGFARDITERKRMEQALEASEQRWQLAVSGANDGIWDWNPTTGEVFFSERWKSMLGYSGDEIGNSVEEWRSRIHPHDLEATMAEVQRHFRGETEYFQSEYRLLCKNGDYMWILDRGRAIFDEHGQPLRMSGSHTDITDRRAAEERIRERNEQLNAIFSLSPDGFISFDDARRIKYVSPDISRLIGISESALIGLDEAAFSTRLAAACLPGSPFVDLAASRAQIQPDSDTVQSSRLPRSKKQRGHNAHQVIEIADADGHVIEVTLRESRSKSVSMVIYLRDITHEFEVDRLKSEFLSTAAHELRTPMASIYGFTELLMQQDFDSKDQGEFLATIFKQSELMVSIINELLDLARIEARRGKDFIIRRIDACTLIRGIIARQKTPDGRSPPHTGPCALPCWILADESKLTQAVSNVLSNAYKYSPAGSRIDIEFVQPEPADALRLLGIRIADHGIGMSPEQLAQVCDRFYRADTSGQVPGTGLGMSIVAEIMQFLHGRLDIESRQGEGSRITLWVPIAPLLPEDPENPIVTPGGKP